MSEQQINMEQLSLQCDEVVALNQQIVQVVGETCQIAP